MQAGQVHNERKFVARSLVSLLVVLAMCPPTSSQVVGQKVARYLLAWMWKLQIQPLEFLLVGSAFQVYTGYLTGFTEVTRARVVRP